MDDIINILTNNTLNILISVGKANLIAFGIILFSYIIEKLTGLRLLIDHYIWVKSVKNTEILSTGDSAYYIILNLIVFIYDIYNDKIELHTLTIVVWIILVAILTQIFYTIHRKYQKVDPNKADDDYT